MLAAAIGAATRHVRNVPMIEDHDERSAAAYEAVTLIKELWSHPAPEKTTFAGRYFRTKNLPFQPAPFQPAGPPIWIGGESDGTLKIVKDLADGWVLCRARRRTSSIVRCLRRTGRADQWPSSKRAA